MPVVSLPKGSSHVSRLRRSALIGFVVAIAIGSAALSGCVAGPLSENDVRDIVASLPAKPGAAANPRVDQAAFSASVLSQIPVYADVRGDSSATVTAFRPPNNEAYRQLGTGEGTETVGQALDVYRQLEQKSGADAAQKALADGGRDAGLSTDDAALIHLLGEGTKRLTFMFGQPSTDATWTWKVESVQLTGPQTADVTYSASPGTGASFTLSTTEFTKKLHFAKLGGRWVLDGWLKYGDFESAVKDAISPSSVISTSVPDWWDTLPAK